MVFGKVVDGLDLLKRIEAVPTSGQRNKPEETIKISNCGEVAKGKDNGVVSAGTGMDKKSDIFFTVKLKCV